MAYIVRRPGIKRPADCMTNSYGTCYQVPALPGGKPINWQGGPLPLTPANPVLTDDKAPPKANGEGFDLSEFFQGEIFGIPTWVLLAGGAALFFFMKK